MRKDQFYYCLDQTRTLLVRPEKREGDFLDVIVILDASMSMQNHFPTLREIATTSLSAGCRVIFFSDEAVCLSPEKEIRWATIEKSGAWAQCTDYYSALSVCLENCSPGVPVMFFTDGSPNGKCYRETLRRLHGALGDEGYMQSCFLGVPCGSQSTVLELLCHGDAKPISVTGADFEKTLRRFLTRTIRVQTSRTTTRVGGYSVCLSGECPPGALALTESLPGADGPFACAIAASILKFLSAQNIESRLVLKVVRDLNKWMAPLVGKHYGVAELVQQGRKLCSELGTMNNANGMQNILNAGKIMVLKQPRGDQSSCNLALLSETALDAMANNPEACVRKAYLARSKVRARTQLFLRHKEHLLNMYGDDLIRSLPLRVVEVKANAGVLEELALLSAGSTATSLERATMVIQNPQCLDVTFGEVKLCASLEETGKHPCLFLIGENKRNLGSACLQMCASVVLGCMSTAMSPWMLLNGVWSLVTSPKSDSSHLQLAKDVLVELVSYCRTDFCKNGKTNPMNFYPNPDPYPFGFSFQDGVLQVPSVRASLFAPLLCDPKSQKTESMEFLIRSVMPALVACKSSWPVIWGQLQDCIFVNFTCSPETMMTAIQDAENLQDVVGACVSNIRVDMGWFDWTVCEEELAKELQRSGERLCPEGIACPSPGWDEISKVHRFITGETEPPTRAMLWAVARFLVSLRVSSAPQTTSHLKMSTIMKAIGLRVENENAFSITTVPANPVAEFVKTRIRNYMLSAPLPRDLDALLSIARLLDIQEHVLPIIRDLPESQRRLTARQGTILLSYTEEEEEAKGILSAILHETLTPEVVHGSWKREWKRMLLEAPCYELLSGCNVCYIKCLSVCMDASRSTCLLEYLLHPPSRHGCLGGAANEGESLMEAAFHLVCHLENRITFAPERLTAHLCLLADVFDKHSLLPMFLDKCIPVENFCVSTEELLATVLSQDNEMCQKIADGISVYHPSIRKTGGVLGDVLRDKYSSVHVCAVVRHIVESWISQIGPTFGETEAFRCVFPKLSHGHVQIRKQCTSQSLSLLLKLRRDVTGDAGRTLGPRMRIHNTALEVLLWCVASGTKTVPSSFVPLA